MKAVILAAGMGKRLGMLAPKSLAVLISGKTIFDYQIERISKFALTDNICVMVGYKSGIEKIYYFMTLKNILIE